MRMYFGPHMVKINSKFSTWDSTEKKSQMWEAGKLSQILRFFINERLFKNSKLLLSKVVITSNLLTTLVTRYKYDSFVETTRFR